MNFSLKDIAIGIQARLNSKRFPKKMEAKLANLTLLEWIFKRLKILDDLSNLYLLTSTEKEDDKLEDLANTYKIKCIRFEDEDNVFQRFYSLSKLKYVDGVVRICGDNPFVDSNRLISLINNAKFEQLDYSWNHCSLPKLSNLIFSDGFGGEYFSSYSLEKLNTVIKDDEREHLTELIPKYRSELGLKIQPGLQNKYDSIEERFDVDYKRDLYFLDNLIESGGVNIHTPSEEISKITKKFLKKIKKNN